MIDLTVNKAQLEKTAERCRERGIVLPTFDQMKHPENVPDWAKKELKNIGLWDVHPRNLFRITWKNEPVVKGGTYGDVNYVEFPPELTGVNARIIALVGKWFPTGAHKVGATYGCLAPRLTTGQFNPVTQKAVWPSTGNYCRGGAYVSALLACESIAILPEEMSKERFEWLSNVAGEVIATPGCESNVKEIFDKCWELHEERGDDIVIFNQFDEFGNHLWHYEVTGNAMLEVLKKEMKPGQEYAGVVLTSGSSGTMGSADFLKEQFPGSKLVVSEALQCPTLLLNGFGGHRIEGIGDKHVPWIHNARNTDMVTAIDDEHPMRLIRLFNEPKGREYLKKQGINPELVDNLDLLGISGVANLLSSIKFARYFELTGDDIVLTVLTDSMELYGSRMRELHEERGEYSEIDAGKDYELLTSITPDYTEELNFYGRKRIHNLKYYTWIEQQQKELPELNAQWHDYRNYWKKIHDMVPKIDERIEEFNAMVRG
ncbi:MAG: pyridoxal-phosphate dependent enzyme [Acidobacteria bacterium]|nr:pyridoxal-phosphate dependent enzyme [Acidobacteriota bacterium]